MQHPINGHKEIVHSFNYKRALHRNCVLMYRERDVPGCIFLIHAAAIKLQTDLEEDSSRHKQHGQHFTCVYTQKPAAADAFLSNAGGKEQYRSTCILPGRNRETSVSENGETNSCEVSRGKLPVAKMCSHLR